MYDLHDYVNRHTWNAIWGRVNVTKALINPVKCSGVHSKCTCMKWKIRHTYVYYEESISESSLKGKSIHKSQCLYFGMFLVVHTLFTTLTIELPQWIVQFILEAALPSQDFCFQTLTSVLRYQHLFRVTQGVSSSSKSGTRACMAEQAILLPDATKKVMVRPTQMGRLQA